MIDFNILYKLQAKRSTKAGAKRWDFPLRWQSQGGKPLVQSSHICAVFLDDVVILNLTLCPDPRLDLSFVLGKMMYLILIRDIGNAMARKRLTVRDASLPSYSSAFSVQK